MGFKYTLMSLRAWKLHYLIFSLQPKLIVAKNFPQTYLLTINILTYHTLQGYFIRPIAKQKLTELGFTSFIFRYFSNKY